MESFFDSVMNNVKSKQRQIFHQAFLEELSLVIEQDPTLEEFHSILDQAKGKGLLNGTKLSHFFRYQRSLNGGGTVVNHNKPNRITEAQKKEGMKKIMGALSESDKELTKTELVLLVADEQVTAKWPSLIGALKKAGFVVDNGEERQKKAYRLTDSGKAFLAEDV